MGRGATTPAMRARALELLRQGLSARAVAARMTAEGTPIGKSTINDIEARRRAGRAPAGDTPDAAALASPGFPPLDVPLEGDLVELDLARLAQLSAAVDQRIEAALAGQEWRGLPTLTRLRLDLGAAISRLRPPPKLDPDQDPTNVAARVELRERVERQLVELERQEVTRTAMRGHLDALDAAAAAEAAAAPPPEPTPT